MDVFIIHGGINLEVEHVEFTFERERKYASSVYIYQGLSFYQLCVAATWTEVDLCRIANWNNTIFIEETIGTMER